MCGEFAKLEFDQDDDAFAFWEAMKVVDEELPVLEVTDAVG